MFERIKSKSPDYVPSFGGHSILNIYIRTTIDRMPGEQLRAKQKSSTWNSLDSFRYLNFVIPLLFSEHTHTLTQPHQRQAESQSSPEFYLYFQRVVINFAFTRFCWWSRAYVFFLFVKMERKTITFYCFLQRSPIRSLYAQISAVIWTTAAND